MSLKAPYPYFGGKSTVASQIWDALGQPKHYIEPFCGSAAVLLARPDYNPVKHMETICDKDGFVANAWRGMQFAPDELAKYCDWPVNHADLNARRKYLNDNQQLLQQLCDDPEYFDAKMAGYWVWAMSCWIGSGLVRPKAMPDVTNAKGCHKTGITEKRPNLGNAGRGVAQDLTRNRPQYEIIKEVIPCQTIFIDQGCHHLYFIRENGTSDLIAVFKLKKHAKIFEDTLLATHTSAPAPEYMRNKIWKHRPEGCVGVCYVTPEDMAVRLQATTKAERKRVLDVLDVELQEIKSRIESSAMGKPLSDRERGRIIGILDAMVKLESLREQQEVPR